MSNLEFQVGAQIVCVDTNWADHGFPSSWTHPQLGNIYTIRQINDDGFGIGFLLEEIVNDPKLTRWGLLEPDWYSWHFRPIKKTDISIFHAILNKTPKKITETV